MSFQIDKIQCDASGSRDGNKDTRETQTALFGNLFLVTLPENFRINQRSDFIVDAREA